MLSSKELKQQAKDSLKGRWGQAVLLNLIPTLITIALIIIIAIPTALLFAHSYNDPAAIQDMTNNTNGGATSSGGGIVSGIISALFMSGISWTYLDILRGTKSTI